MNTNSPSNVSEPKKPRLKKKKKSPFRINLTVVAFFLLIFGSIAAGIVAGFASYRLGRESLSTVTTPQENPTEKLPMTTANKDSQPKEFEITEERKILVQVYDFVVAKKEELKLQSGN